MLNIIKFEFLLVCRFAAVGGGRCLCGWVVGVSEVVGREELGSRESDCDMHTDLIKEENMASFE